MFELLSLISVPSQLVNFVSSLILLRICINRICTSLIYLNQGSDTNTSLSRTETKLAQLVWVVLMVESYSFSDSDQLVYRNLFLEVQRCVYYLNIVVEFDF